MPSPLYPQVGVRLSCAEQPLAQLQALLTGQGGGAGGELHGRRGAAAKTGRADSEAAASATAATTAVDVLQRLALVAARGGGGIGRDAVQRSPARLLPALKVANGSASDNCGVGGDSAARLQAAVQQAAAENEAQHLRDEVKTGGVRIICRNS
jgi:hypothetical protein